MIASLELPVANALLEVAKSGQCFGSARDDPKSLSTHDALEEFCEWFLGKEKHCMTARTRESLRNTRKRAIDCRAAGAYPFGFNSEVYEYLFNDLSAETVKDEQVAFVSALGELLQNS